MRFLPERYSTSDFQNSVRCLRAGSFPDKTLRTGFKHRPGCSNAFIKEIWSILSTMTPKILTLCRRMLTSLDSIDVEMTSRNRASLQYIFLTMTVDSLFYEKNTELKHQNNIENILLNITFSR